MSPQPGKYMRSFDSNGIMKHTPLGKDGVNMNLDGVTWNAVKSYACDQY